MTLLEDNLVCPVTDTEGRVHNPTCKIFQDAQGRRVFALWHEGTQELMYIGIRQKDGHPKKIWSVTDELKKQKTEI
jgi:hypothetical protein